MADAVSRQGRKRLAPAGRAGNTARVSMDHALVSGLIAGYAVAMPVGAVAVMLITMTARTSYRVGAAAAIGVATADGLYATVAVLGGAAAAALVRPVAAPLRWLAGAVLVGLAVRTAVLALRRRAEAARVRGAARPDPRGPFRAYLGYLGLTLLNPWTVLYFAALVLAGTGRFGGAASGLYVGAVFVASASWQLLLAGGGVLLGRVVTGPRGRMVTALVSSAVIVALAITLVLSG